MRSSGSFPEDLLDEMAREDEVQAAVYAFNLRPRRGISSLCAAYQEPETPFAIAHLLHTVPGLLGKQIGEYLSRRENEFILLEFFNQLDLRYPFLPALRQALSSSLHLPGEAEQIDRVVQSWASCWVAANPECTLTADTAYILAFAAVMLNSDLHNPQVKQRMSAQAFIQNLRGALNSDQMTDSELVSVYESIKNEQFTVNHSGGDEFLALSGPRLRGTLAKRRANFFSAWTSRYFVLTDGCLYYFKDQEASSCDGGPAGVLQLVNVDIQAVDDNKIQIASTEGALQYVKFEKKKPPQMVRAVAQILLRASSRKTRDKWLYRIQTSYMHASFTGEVGTAAPGDLRSVSEVMSPSISEPDVARMDGKPIESDSQDPDRAAQTPREEGEVVASVS
jgi:hypothetical protein